MGHHAADGGKAIAAGARATDTNPNHEADHEADQADQDGHHDADRGADAGDAAARDAAAMEDGRLLFAREARFVAGAAAVSQIPRASLPEVAFAGRSNVGKSSLINALTGRRRLAITSVTPGRTRQVNFFDLGGRLMLADLPGYGYARAAKTQVANWTRLIEAYLQGRASLRRVVVLIDARHGLKQSDEAVMALLDRAAVSYQAVLTKCDKVAAEELAARLAETSERLARRAAAHPGLVATSAQDGRGIADLRAMLAQLARPGG
jgi:GTP-binding protein